MAQQKLITAEIKKFLKAHLEGSQDGKQGEAKVACRLFCPFSHALTWYILEARSNGKKSRFHPAVMNMSAG